MSTRGVRWVMRASPLKPADDTPLSCKTFVDLLVQAGLPPAWCRFAPCDLASAERMVTDSRVAFFSFIGSAKVGWMLRAKLAPGTRCALEHGGAAPVIVDSGVDSAMMIPKLVKGGFYHSGQVCVSVQRVFAPRAQAAALAEGIAAHASRLVVGNAIEETTECGPLIRPREVTRVADWVDEAVVLLDQTLIPSEETYRSYKDVESLIDAIKRLVVRGAPAIGVAGAYGVVVAIDEAKAKGLDPHALETMIDGIRDARPTAVNLAWAVERVRRFVPEGRRAVLAEARKVAEEDRLSGDEMARIGADWLMNRLGERPLTVLTHCNTGSLATTSIGTALGVIRELHRRGSIKEVYADETRPLLQGSRLTAWELKKSKIPYRIQPDGAATMAILSGRIDAALIGADRVAKNGDAANKIGSLAVALACHEAGIPFLVVAPESTVDRGLSDGSAIHIEIRSDEELTKFKGIQVAPLDAKTFNPAFDVTPAKYISAVITEQRAYEIAQGETL